MWHSFKKKNYTYVRRSWYAEFKISQFDSRSGSYVRNRVYYYFKQDLSKIKIDSHLGKTL